MSVLGTGLDFMAVAGRRSGGVVPSLSRPMVVIAAMDSFGERGMWSGSGAGVSASPSASFAGFARGTVSGTSISGESLTIDGKTITLNVFGTDTASLGQAIAGAINNNANWTMVVSGVPTTSPVIAFVATSSGVTNLSLYQVTRGQSFTVTAIAAALGISTGTYTPRTNLPVDTQTALWQDELTVSTGRRAWGPIAMAAQLSGGRIVLDDRWSRPTGGANSGQWTESANALQRLPQLLATIDDARAAGSYVDAVYFPYTTNELTADFTTTNSRNNYIQAFEAIAAKDVKILTHPIGPRGTTSFLSQYVDGTGSVVGSPGNRDVRPFMDTTANDLVNVIANRPALAGKLFAATDWVALVSAQGAAWNVLGTTTGNANVLDLYDGVHPSVWNTSRAMGPSLAGAAATAFPGTLVDVLPTSGTNASNWLGSAAFMTPGTGGTVTVAGSSANNVGFTLNGFSTAENLNQATVPQSWTIATTSGWAQIAPNNITGTVTTAIDGEDFVVTVNCNSSSKNNENTQTLRFSIPFAMPAEGSFAAGEEFEAWIGCAMSGLSGCRGVSVNLSLIEPDAVTRIKYGNDAPPNGTVYGAAGMKEWHPATMAAQGMMRFSSPRVTRKAGAYGACALWVDTLWAGLLPTLTGTIRFRRAYVGPARK